MKIRRRFSVPLLVATVIFALASIEEKEAPWQEWTDVVATRGQPFPVPAYWVRTPEGAIAHDLVLPESVPRPVPFDFAAAEGPWYRKKNDEEVGKAYFDHLCRTEAGEWILERHKDVEGLYFARPLGEVTAVYLSHLSKVEAPFVEKEFHWMGDGLRSRGGNFVSPPFRNYVFVEEPRRQTEWQREIEAPYIRIFGHTTSWDLVGGQVRNYEQKTPMQVRGIESPVSRFAYTWRGITRPLDRKYRIAGGELIIYERESKRVIAVSRTFQRGRKTRSPSTISSWVQSPACSEGIWPDDLFISEFARRVLEDKPFVINSQDKGTYLWRYQRRRNYMNTP